MALKLLESGKLPIRGDIILDIDQDFFGVEEADARFQQVDLLSCYQTIYCYLFGVITLTCDLE